MSENFEFDEQQAAPEEELPQAEEQPHQTMQEPPYQAAAEPSYRAAAAEEPHSYQPYNAAGYQSYSQPTYQTFTPNYGGYAQNTGWSQPAPMTPEKPEKPKKEKKGFGAGKLVALGLCCAIIGGAMGFGGAWLGNRLGAEEGTPGKGSASVVYEGERETNVINTVRVDTNEMKTAAEVYAENVNSTVGITTSITTNYWGYQTTSAASGSGFILTEDGYLLTNYHVVEGSNSIKATMYDGTSYEAALIGYDASNDIAVLKIDAQGLTPVVLGNSDNMNVGDPVVAIGNPLGELTFSLTQGAISALDREITLSGGTTMNLMQTDCAINSGNSGGALFNLYGEVVGITNAKYSSNAMSEASIDNIGFAIPINTVRSIVESIIENGYIAKPYIGVTVSDVSEETQSYGLPKGAAIKSVAEDSPAEKAGLKANDIITAVNGEEISGQSDLVKLVKAASVGDKLEMTVYRQGETLELTVEVGEQVQSAIGSTDDQDTTTESQGYFPWGFGFGN